MSAQLRLAQGQPVEVTLEHVTKLLSPLTGSTCRAHLGLGDAGSMWSIQGPLTHVSMPPDGTGKPSSMDIQAVKGGYIVKTKHLSTAQCGARGQWPDEVFIPTAGGPCRVNSWQPAR